MESRRPASWILTLWRTQVSTSSASRDSGVAWLTPLVASERQAVSAREIDQGLVAGFFGAIVVALQFDVDVSCAE